MVFTNSHAVQSATLLNKIDRSARIEIKVQIVYARLR